MEVDQEEINQLERLETPNYDGCYTVIGDDEVYIEIYDYRESQ